MDYRNLGGSGMKVSPVCLGTMMFGGRTDADEANRIIKSARSAGCNFIDTADVYNDGISESIVGQLLASDRQNWIIASKVGNPIGDDPNQNGLSRRRLLLACESSLQRLKIDWIDVYYLHREDLDTPIEETLAGISDLLQSGKIRSYGISNFRSWRIAEICRLADKFNIPRPCVNQPYYNAFNRMPEVEQLPACRHYGLSVFPYSPIARGVLTGKYLPDQAPAKESRAGSGDTRIMQSEWRPESLILAQKVKLHAEARNLTTAQFAAAWVLGNKLITGFVAGPRTCAQWEDYLPALNYEFTAEDEAFIDNLVPTGHPSTPGYSDPKYPIEGRVID